MVLIIIIIASHWPKKGDLGYEVQDHSHMYNRIEWRNWDSSQNLTCVSMPVSLWSQNMEGWWWVQEVIRSYIASLRPGQTYPPCLSLFRNYDTVSLVRLSWPKNSIEMMLAWLTFCPGDCLLKLLYRWLLPHLQILSPDWAACGPWAIRMIFIQNYFLIVLTT